MQSPYIVATLQAVADFCGVSFDTVGNWRSKYGMPGEPNQWDIREIVRWLVKRRKVYVAESKVRGEGEDDEEDDPTDRVLAAAPMELTERWLRSRIENNELSSDKKKLELEEAKKNLVRADTIKASLQDVVMVIRNFGSTLEKAYGAEGIELHEELCEAIDEVLPSD